LSDIQTYLYFCRKFVAIAENNDYFF
jgi:hypothetical protein